MKSDSVMLDGDDATGETTLELEVHLDFERPPPLTVAEERDAVFDPVLCAELHNKIIEKILQLQPSWRPHVQRNLFNVEPRRFLLERNTDPEEASKPREPVSEDIIRDRLGGDMATFFELIDIISIKTEHWIDGNRQVSYHTLFMPFFDSPNPELLYDFSDNPTLEDHPYVIQLYPTSYSFACEAQAGGIMFDLMLGLATFARPYEVLELPPKTTWVPLDVVLREWMKLIQDDKVYWGDSGELDEKKWTDKAVRRALNEWNEYLNLLEKKVQQTGVGPKRGAIRRMVDDETLDKWSSTINHFALAFLKQARAPAGDINRIGPGLTCFNSRSFDAMHEAQKATDWSVTDDLEILKDRYHRLSTIGNGWLTTLIFPATGEHSLWSATDNRPFGQRRVPKSHLLNHNLGVYVIGNHDSSAVIDHEGTTQTFQRQHVCPWGSMWEFPLANMFQAWQVMIETEQWKAGPNGVEDDCSWFARNRNIDWISNTKWYPNLVDADGEELGEMKNDWVQWPEDPVFPKTTEEDDMVINARFLVSGRNCIQQPRLVDWDPLMTTSDSAPVLPHLRETMFNARTHTADHLFIITGGNTSSRPLLDRDERSMSQMFIPPLDPQQA